MIFASHKFNILTHRCLSSMRSQPIISAHRRFKQHCDDRPQRYAWEERDPDMRQTFPANQQFRPNPYLSGGTAPTPCEPLPASRFTHVPQHPAIYDPQPFHTSAAVLAGSVARIRLPIMRPQGYHIRSAASPCCDAAALRKRHHSPTGSPPTCFHP
jgi:hypothetical protein